MVNESENSTITLQPYFIKSLWRRSSEKQRAQFRVSIRNFYYSNAPETSTSWGFRNFPSLFLRLQKSSPCHYGGDSLPYKKQSAGDLDVHISTGLRGHWTRQFIKTRAKSTRIYLAFSSRIQGVITFLQFLHTPFYAELPSLDFNILKTWRVLENK